MEDLTNSLIFGMLSPIRVCLFCRKVFLLLNLTNKINIVIFHPFTRVLSVEDHFQPFLCSYPSYVTVYPLPNHSSKQNQFPNQPQREFFHLLKICCYVDENFVAFDCLDCFLHAWQNESPQSEYFFTFCIQQTIRSNNWWRQGRLMQDEYLYGQVHFLR